MKKIITRIKGGLGNQLFCYSAARRLALANNAELVVDDVTGFSRDRNYHRKYMLDRFNIPARKATPAERLEPFERYRRGIMKWLSSRKPFSERRYLMQEGRNFDERLLALKVKGTLYLDGLWQSEGYFKDVENVIRQDMRITPPNDELNKDMAFKISNSNSVALHVRWFDVPGSTSVNNLSVDYYRNSIALIESMIESPCYFLFSDNPDAINKIPFLPKERVRIISHNRGDDNAYADMWLMLRCHHFIISNSTFSWWGAWLRAGKEKIVICPSKINPNSTIKSWNFEGQIPRDWLQI